MTTTTNNLIERVKASLTENGYTPTIGTVNKNGVDFTGISVKGLRVSPTIYAEDLTEANVDAMVAGFLDHIEKAKKYDFIVTDFTWDNVKNQVYPYLAHVDKIDTDLFRKVDDTDLCVGVRYHLDADGESATIKITNALVKRWDVDADTVINQAIANIDANDNSEYRSLADFVGFPFPDMFPPMYYIKYADMYSFGAGAIMSPKMRGLMSVIFDGDFMIIPSSIHEVICIPVSDEAETLADMIRCVNGDQLAPEDILSDHAYIYHKATDTIAVA